MTRKGEGPGQLEVFFFCSSRKADGIVGKLLTFVTVRTVWSNEWFEWFEGLTYLREDRWDSSEEERKENKNKVNRDVPTKPFHIFQIQIACATQTLHCRYFHNEVVLLYSEALDQYHSNLPLLQQVPPSEQQQHGVLFHFFDFFFQFFNDGKQRTKVGAISRQKRQKR